MSRLIKTNVYTYKWHAVLKNGNCPLHLQLPGNLLPMKGISIEASLLSAINFPIFSIGRREHCTTSFVMFAIFSGVKFKTFAFYVNGNAFGERFFPQSLIGMNVREFSTLLKNSVI